MSDVVDAVACLAAGGLLVYPTETVYGIGTALSAGEEGIARLRAAKCSPSHRPYILLASDAESAFSLWSAVPEGARELAVAAWPGPLTLIGPAREGLPAGVLGRGPDGEATVSVRVPGDPWLIGLLQELDEPLLSTSANRAGDPPPVDFGEVLLGPLAPDLAIDRGPCAGGVPSTLISLVSSPPAVLRQGAWELPVSP